MDNHSHLLDTPSRKLHMNLNSYQLRWRRELHPHWMKSQRCRLTARGRDAKLSLSFAPWCHHLRNGLRPNNSSQASSLAHIYCVLDSVKTSPPCDTMIAPEQFPTKSGFSQQFMTRNDCSLRVKEQINFDSQRQHWTTSTSSGGSIWYFDNLFPGALSEEVKQQLRALYGHLMKNPKVMVVRVQQQQGTVDCAIAYAVSLVKGKDPVASWCCKHQNITFL